MIRAFPESHETYNTEKTWRPTRQFKFFFERGAVNSQLQQLKANGASPRLGQLSPNAPSIPNQVCQGVAFQVLKPAVFVKTLDANRSTVGLTFQRDPADKSFTGCNVYVKNYYGNPHPVQIAVGQDSPIKINLDRTGERVSIFMQGAGNQGNAFLNGSPNVVVHLT